LIPLIIGSAANALLAAVLLLRINAAVAPAIILGDLATLGAFTVFAPYPLLIVGMASALLFTGMLRLSAFATALHAAGLVLIVVVAALLGQGATDQSLMTAGEFPLILLSLIALVIVAIAGSFTLERQISAQQKHIIALSKGETEELNQMRERSRAIYELATTISSTLNYERILNAVLEAGHVALKLGDEGALTAAVLLFRGNEQGLYVAASRRFTRNDEKVIVPGTKGIIGEGLREATPIFANNISEDPELQYFTAFQFVRSALCVPLRAGYDNYGVLLYGSDEENAFDEEQGELLSAIGSQATIAMQNAVLYNSLLLEKQRIVEVEEDARKKLARDLHDGPTQTVSAIAMRINYISRLLERDPAQVPSELRRVEELARNTVKEIRHMLFLLRPLVLETQGIGAALQQLGEKMLETHNQKVAVRLGRDVEGLLDAHKQGVLFYIVEEAVNNARKHAKADLITVTMGRKDQMLICQIKDNGVGFDPQAVNTNYEKRGSLGMVNMRERVALLEGTFRIDSAPGKGTTVTIYIPLKSKPAHQVEPANSNGKPSTKLAMAVTE